MKTIVNKEENLFKRIRINLERLDRAKKLQSKALSNLVKLVDIQDNCTEIVFIMNKLGLIKTSNYSPTKLFDTSSLIKMNHALRSNSKLMENNFVSDISLKQLN